MGGPGDHWCTDLFAWNVAAFGESADSLNRDVQRYVGDALLRDGHTRWPGALGAVAHWGRSTKKDSVDLLLSSKPSAISYARTLRQGAGRSSSRLSPCLLTGSSGKGGTRVTCYAKSDQTHQRRMYSSTASEPPGQCGPFSCGLAHWPSMSEGVRTRRSIHRICEFQPQGHDGAGPVMRAGEIRRDEGPVDVCEYFARRVVRVVGGYDLTSPGGHKLPPYAARVVSGGTHGLNLGQAGALLFSSGSRHVSALRELQDRCRTSRS